MKQGITPQVPKMKHHANDWKIVTSSEKEIERISGLEFLSSNSFPGRCVDWLFISCANDRAKYTELIEKMVVGRWYFVVITGNGFRSIQLVDSIESLEDKLKTISMKCDLDVCSLTFLNMIQKSDDCCAGVVLSDGKGRLRIEIMPDSVNTRDLTDGSKNSSDMIYLETGLVSIQLLHGADNDYINNTAFSFVRDELVRCCYHIPGYYEFIYGAADNSEMQSLFFTYYSNNVNYGFEENYHNELL